MSFSQPAKFRWPAAIILTGLWTYPLIRWGRTFVSVLNVHAETGSNNSYWDVLWNKEVGAGYFLCLIAAGIAVYFFDWTKPIGWLGIVPATCTAAFFCICPYDGLIIIAPMGNPLFPAIIGLIGIICWVISWAFCHRVASSAKPT